MKGQRGMRDRERVGRDCKWMEEVREGGEEEPAQGILELLSSDQTTADGQSHHTSWCQALSTLGRWSGWSSFIPVGVVWLLCQVEAALHPSVSLVDVCQRLLVVCLLWMVVGACVYALKYRLQPGQDQVKLPGGMQQEVATEIRKSQCSWMSQLRSTGSDIPLALALANSLLLCVLQEPLPDPSVPQIQALLHRLESVSHTLEKADTGSQGTPQEVDQDSILTDKVNILCTYLQQRMKSLRALVQVQGDFEASVKDMLEGVDGLWAQLEQLHTGVTLTKEGGQGQVDLALAHTEAENLFSVLGCYRNRLQCCQTCLTDSTQLLQELTWTHTHMSSGIESVWPELLLQSNIEQFDKVQESFLSLEQQTSTFQTHLEGLRKENQERHARPLTHDHGSNLCSVSPQTSPHLHNRRVSDMSLENYNLTSASTSTCSMEKHTRTDTPLSLCERSALQFSSTIGRLHKSRRRK